MKTPVSRPGSRLITFAQAASSSIVLLFCLSHAAALDFTVDSLADVSEPGIDGACSTLVVGDPKCTLREALQETEASSPTPDMITFSPGLTGTILLGSALPQIVNSSLFVNGPGSDLITIDGQDAVRIFDVNGGSITIGGLRLTRGSGDFGGAIRALNGTVFLEEVVIDSSASTTSSSGAVHAHLSTLTIQRSRISENTSWHDGGAISASLTDLILEDSVVAGNTASNNGSGGGLFFEGGGNATITRSVFENNTAAIGGGGVALSAGSGDAIRIEDSTFTGNSSLSGTFSVGGGGIRVMSASDAIVVVILHNVTLTGNSAPAGGGAYINAKNGVTIVANSTISGNRVETTGSGIYNDSSYVELSNVTVTKNSGGSALGPAVTHRSFNSVIAENIGGGTGFGPDCAGTINGNNSLVGDSTGCLFVGSGHIWLTPPDLLDPRLFALAQNGGGEPTHLQEATGGSNLLVDAGTPTGPSTGCTWDHDGDASAVTISVPLVNDQRGETRTYDGGVGSDRCDIGAVEWTHCDDGIQNNGETGVDCGNASCPTCNCTGADPAAIGGTTYTSVQNAYADAYDGAMIKVIRDTASVPLILDRDIYARYSLGEDCDRFANPGTTVFQSPLSIDVGTLVLLAGVMTIN